MNTIYIKNRKTFILWAGITLLALLTLLAYWTLTKNFNQPTLAPIYQGNENKKEVALTVNVFWGDEFIEPMLDILKQNNVKATFFIGGTWAEKNPDLLKKIAAAGENIGSHGYSHPHPDQLSKNGNLKEIKKAEKIITDITHQPLKLFAPPYGERGTSVLEATEEAGYQCILWSVDTIDWQHPAPETIIQRVEEKAHNGAIVLMHPTASTVKALPEIIKTLKKDNYHFVPVSEMIENLPKENTNQEK